MYTTCCDTGQTWDDWTLVEAMATAAAYRRLPGVHEVKIYRQGDYLPVVAWFLESDSWDSLTFGNRLFWADAATERASA